MKVPFASTLVALTLAASPAFAQGAPAGQAPAFDRGYAEAVAQSAFGNVTSQNFGAEVGVTVFRTLQVYGEFGTVRDAATSELSTAAQTIAGALATVQSGAVAYQVKQPITHGGGGVRYVVPVANRAIRPYVMAGFGVAQVKKDVTFTIGGSASSVAQYVTLGSDLTGEESASMFTFGGGIGWAAWRQLMVDLQFRVGRIATETPITVSRAGLGIGVRF